MYVLDFHEDAVDLQILPDVSESTRMPVLSCQCGEKSEVRPSMAGATIKCSRCGGDLTVPALRVLRAYADRGEPIPPTETCCAAVSGS